MSSENDNKDKKLKYMYSFENSDVSIERTWFKIVWHLTVIGFTLYVTRFILIALIPTNFGFHPVKDKHLYAVPFVNSSYWMFQSVFLMLAFIHDIYEWRDKQENPWAKKIAYWRDIIFQSMVVPYTLFVSTMFWTLYLYDRELVFPKVYDVILPWWFNHCVHTNITIIILVETVLQARRYPVNLKLEMILNGVIAIAYAVVYYSIFFFAHRWLYNVFGVLTWWQVVLYQILIWSSSFFFYYIQFPINRMIHGAEPATEKTIVDRVDADVPEKLPEDMTKDETSIANFEISSMQKKQDDGEDPFSSDNWSLKYRSLRDKFENSRL